MEDNPVRKNCNLLSPRKTDSRNVSNVLLYLTHMDIETQITLHSYFRSTNEQLFLSFGGKVFTRRRNFDKPRMRKILMKSTYLIFRTLRSTKVQV